MEIKKQKHKEEIRHKILNAAKKLFVEKGYEATSIRKIAAEIGFSPTTIYLYYKDKDDIIYALHKEGFYMMHHAFTSLLNVQDPFERLKAMGKSYIQFALQHTDFYEVMFIMKDPMRFLDEHCVAEEWPEGERVLHILVETIIACQESGYFKGLHAPTVAIQAWISVHGICSLYFSGHLKKIFDTMFAGQEHQDVLEQAYQVFVHYLTLTK